MRGLVINADDLSIHPDIDAGIVSAYRNGALTSCTMLMTTAHVEATMRQVVRPGLLPVGLHLSLTLGKAVAPPAEVPDLIDGEGHLKLSAARLLIRPSGPRVLAQIRREFEAQLALARDYGLAPTHADSHQHVHMAPEIFAVVEELLPRFGIRRIRFCRERLPRFAFGRDAPALLRRLNPLKWALLRWRAAGLRPSLETTDGFFGVVYSGALTRRALWALIETVPPDRSLEIGIHPGFPAPMGGGFYPRPGYNDFIASPARRLEHDILVDPGTIALIRRRGLALCGFDGRPKG
jgi:hypothetical protein